MAGAQKELTLPYQFAAACPYGYFVELTGDQTAQACDATTDWILGVQTVDITSADITAYGPIMGGVQVSGVAWVVAGAAITRGVLVSTTATGKAQAAVSTQFPRGRALKAAAADGDLIPVLLLMTSIALA